MRQIIRRRDQALAGSVNPMLLDFGARSEAIQYSGRKIEGTWTCPFHAKKVENHVH
jgi:FPC/CPF motif-containing protein YcgG